MVLAGSARIENGKGIATIKLSSAVSDADAVSKIREGVIRNISVRYLIHSSARIVGESGQPDVVEVRDWEPLEVSAVPIPADPGARIRKHGSNARQPLSRRERRFRNGAAEATRLLQSTQTRAQARGANEARAILGRLAEWRQLARSRRLAAARLRTALPRRANCCEAGNEEERKSKADLVVPLVPVGYQTGLAANGCRAYDWRDRRDRQLGPSQESALADRAAAVKAQATLSVLTLAGPARLARVTALACELNVADRRKFRFDGN